MSISIITGTGFGTSDFSNWGGFPTTILLILMFVGGCAGSTTCGLRMARIQVLIANAKAQVSKLIRPHAVVVSYYNQKPIPENVAESVMGFFFLYIISFAVIASLLGGLGLDLVTAISGQLLLLEMLVLVRRYNWSIRIISIDPRSRKINFMCRNDIRSSRNFRNLSYVLTIVLEELITNLNRKFSF